MPRSGSRLPMHYSHKLLLGLVFTASAGLSLAAAKDHIRDLQAEAFSVGQANWGHWGHRPDLYNSWNSHTNRLIPVYTFGATLDAYRGARSPYRNSGSLRTIYGRVPEGTLNPDANYFDNTQIYDLQKRAVEAGKKYIFLIIFDGMDWHTTRSAAVYTSQGNVYQSGRGSGLSFQDYAGAVTDYGYMATAPHNNGTLPNPDNQTISFVEGTTTGGYHPHLGGETPWARPLRPLYLTGKLPGWPHPYTDSAAAATAMTSGMKTYNKSINMTVSGSPTTPLARLLQSQYRFATGVVTSVPISHATPACAYANNVTRQDYQDLTRDMLGLPSISHPNTPLPGLDVLLGAGWGDNLETDPGQGSNFVPGNRYLTNRDLAKLGQRYEIAMRTPRQQGGPLLARATTRAITSGRRLFGYFGTKRSHLPFATADGSFNPVGALKEVETYTSGDVTENPTLAEMTKSALRILDSRDSRFWLMVEAGDVDWANHGNNLDNSIGAVLSGAAAFDVITEWIETKKAWRDSVVIVTADHGHLCFIRDPSVLIRPETPTDSTTPGRNR